MVLSASAGEKTSNTSQSSQHVTVAIEKGRSKGWPVNHGMWNWGDEIVVMYNDAAADMSDLNRHAFKKPFSIEQARSTDGGLTWTIEKDPIKKPGSRDRPWDGQDGPRITPLADPIDFSHRDFALNVRSAHHEFGPTYFYYTYDRGRSWKGPHPIPDFDWYTLAARTDYLVNGKHDCSIFVSPNKRESNEDGQEVWMLRTTDGGQTWKPVARASRAVEPKGGDKANFAIQPSSARISSMEILTISRNADGGTNAFSNTLGRNWLEAWASTDAGKTWSKRSEIDVNNTSTPPALTRLSDGRLVVTYGYRAAPYGIRARVSGDNAKSWSDEIVLRKDGGNPDLGYTRNVVRTDGNLVTAYYYNTDPNKARTIQATIWNAGNVARSVNK